MSNSLLINEHPLQVLPTLARQIGLDEAIALQQLHYWITISKKNLGGKKHINGKWWVYNTYEEWKDTDFPFWSVHKIGRIFRSLEKQGLVISRKIEASDWIQRKWYTIDYTKLHDLELQNCTFLKGNTETSSETTTIDGVVKIYKANISKQVEPIILQELEQAVNQHGPDLVIEAIAIAVKAKVKTWRYIDSVLKNKSSQPQREPMQQASDGGFDF